MQGTEHPARRPTRYHWAAGLNPLHWGPAAAGWLATAITGGMAAAGQEWAGVLPGITATASLAWTALWLFIVPVTPRFRRLTDANLMEKYANDYGYQLETLTEGIHPDLSFKVVEITALRDRARKILADKFGSHDPFARDNLEKLDTLAISYLQLLSALSEYDEYLSLVDPGSIEKDLAEAQAAAADAPDDLKPARERTVELLQSRLERYNKGQKRVKLIQAQCQNVEATMKLLVDQAMTAHDAKRVGKDIDVVLGNIRESEILSEELSAFDELESELGSHRMRDLE